MRLSLSRMLCVILSFSLLLSMPSRSTAAEKETYTIAVVPNLPAVMLHKNWTPLVDHLSRELGVNFELKLYDKITTFLEDTQAGHADFTYSAPNMFYLAYQRQKYVPLVRSSKPLQGLVFVRKDSPYSKVSDLKGKTIAFVGPKSICSVISRHAMLTGQGGIDFNSSFSGSTINVAKSVLLGKADAGATLDTSMISDLPEMRNEFRILLETEKIAPHPLSAHPRIPKKFQDAVASAILKLDKTDEGRKLLDTVKLSKPMRADFKRDYAFYSKVDLGKMDQ